MANLKSKCVLCTVISNEKNYEQSKWCPDCKNWKPKDTVFCECCRRHLRSTPRKKRGVLKRM